MEKAIQRVKILNYCTKHGSITIREAFEKLGINSPSKRISEMRHSPRYIVESIRVEKIKPDGEIVRFKRYFISEVAQ